MMHLRLLFVLPALLLLASTAFSQVASTPFVEVQGTYSTITGTTVCTPAGYHDDEAYAIAMPFSFLYDGVSYNTVYVTTNGYATFQGSYPYFYYMPPLNCATYGYPGVPVISPWGDDLHGNYQGTISYETSGAAPNRVLTMQWQDWMTYYSQGDKLNFQIKLYETSNMIEFVYGTILQAPAGMQTIQVGIKGHLANDVQNRTGSWVGSTYSTSVSATKSYNSATLPPPGYTYRFGCYVPGGSATVEMTDANGNLAGYFNTPGTVYAKYMVNYPPGEEYDVNITLNFYRIGDPSGMPVYTESFLAHKPVGTLNGLRPINLSLTPGYYRVEAIFNMWNNCLMYEDYVNETSTLLIAPGTVLCEVWPGDVNNNGVVNYGDRHDLNKYIHDANLSPVWLNGPARFLIEGQKNPMVYLDWFAQPSVPWATADGCYMDSDGNGVINNFDFIAIKVNWMRNHGGTPAKSGAGINPTTFDMGQNYPNPFNPTTSIEYSVPERSKVTMVVTDALGRTVETLVNGTFEAGVHSVQFNASNLSSGMYIATVNMTSMESGLSFSRTIKMSLSK